ncbi:hypothetical protein ACIQPR_29850 [Streptomyces sp. NPDC091280]|uniref:hypothetical protein n=1 Tax=Streptomyces sp. NPDC091280 TaxID=3365984 RepID=UPI00380041B5
MSRGEEEAPLDLSKPESAGEPPESAPRHSVVISADGSAAIDGEPVPVAEGESVDAAILDRLQAFARDLDASVTATISDPAAGYVAFVEVAPDGSSSLLDQQEPQEHLDAPSEPAVADDVDGADFDGPDVDGSDPDGAEPESSEPEGADTYVKGEDEDDEEDDEDDEDDEDEDDEEEVDDDEDEDDGFGVGAYSREQPLTGAPPLAPPPPPAPEPAPVARIGPQAAPRGGTRQSDDEYKSPGLLHKPLVVGPVALTVAALVIVPLVIMGSSASDDGGRQKQAARSSDEKKTPLPEDTTLDDSATATTPPRATPASPSAKPKASKSAKATKTGGGTGGTGGSGGVEGPGGVTVTVTAKPPRATVTAKPAQDTAATAVNRLHKNDPSGRHICYRAYLSGQGWQKPVCDGTLAGTTSGTHPIQALNIAVYGGDGSAANAFVHDPASTNGQGKWEPQWTAIIGDGKNNYIGSTKSGAPYMTGFAINIGSGQICRSAKVHGFDWGSSDCTQARPGFIFGGALENTRWLEAVKLWV